jgi:hypothetical protein
MKGRIEGRGLDERRSQMFDGADHTECLWLMQRGKGDQLIQFADIAFVETNRSCELISTVNHAVTHGAHRCHIEMHAEHFECFCNDIAQIFASFGVQAKVKDGRSFGQMKGEGPSAEIHQALADTTRALRIPLKQTDLQ